MGRNVTLELTQTYNNPVEGFDANTKEISWRYYSYEVNGSVQRVRITFVWGEDEFGMPLHTHWEGWQDPRVTATPPDWFMLATLMFEKDDGA